MDVSDWITRCLKDTMDEGVGRMQAGLAILASIGSTAPFVGLFGTVWGIYHALLAIGATGQTSIDQVAGPVGESLIMTAFGLFVAIPAVLGYNALTRANKSIVDQAEPLRARPARVLRDGLETVVEQARGHALKR